jgi:voltage-gated potassium channel Kch
MNPPVTPRLLILGDRRSLADALAVQMAMAGGSALTVLSGTDAELGTTLLETGWTAVAVLTRDDALALRLTLLSAHVRPDLTVWATFFDHSILHRFSEIVSSVNVVPAAEIVAGELARLCCASAGPTGARARNGLRVVDDALRLMLVAGVALTAAMLVQLVATMLSLHDGFVDALYYSTRSIATVADAPRADQAGVAFKLISTATTMLAVALMAVFTAALIRRLSRPRLTTLLGRRRPVARNHVLIVGFGQIGFRLAQALVAANVPVIALERDINAPCVRLARRAGIPVAIGRGDDRATLELLGVRGAATVAAVTSEDLINVAIGLAASDVRAEVPLVLHVGDGNVAAETQSLLHLGRVCDGHELIARWITAEVLGAVPTDRPRSPLPDPAQ